MTINRYDVDLVQANEEGLWCLYEEACAEFGKEIAALKRQYREAIDLLILERDRKTMSCGYHPPLAKEQGQKRLPVCEITVDASWPKEQGK